MDLLGQIWSDILVPDIGNVTSECKYQYIYMFFFTNLSTVQSILPPVGLPAITFHHKDSWLFTTKIGFSPQRLAFHHKDSWLFTTKIGFSPQRFYVSWTNILDQNLWTRQECLCCLMGRGWCLSLVHAQQGTELGKQKMLVPVSHEYWWCSHRLIDSFGLGGWLL